MAGAAGRTDGADDGQRIVLGADAGRRRPVDGHAHVLRLGLAQGLGRQHMLDLGRADALGQRPEGAVSRGVAIAADDGHAWLGAPLLWPHHMDDAVAQIAHGEIFDAVLGDIALQGQELQPRLLVGHGCGAQGLALGRHIVVGHGERAVGPSHRATGGAQAGEGLGRGHLVDQVQVDIEDRLPVPFGDEVSIPDLVIERLGGHGRLCRWAKAVP